MKSENSFENDVKKERLKFLHVVALVVFSFALASCSAPGNSGENTLQIPDGLDRFDEVRWGLLDKTGKVSFLPSDIIPLSKMSDGLVVYKEKDSDRHYHGVIDKNGRREVFNEWILSVGEFVNGIAPAGTRGDGIHGTYCYIDRHARLAFQGEFWQATTFSDGLAAVAVKEDNKLSKGQDRGSKRLLWCYIDRRGKTVLPSIYTEAGPFVAGRAIVERAVYRPEKSDY